MTRCRAVAGTLIPSHHEREHYCRSDGSGDCPTYRLFQLRRAPVTQEAYYSLWMPPAPAALEAAMLPSRAAQLVA